MAFSDEVFAIVRANPVLFVLDTEQRVVETFSFLLGTMRASERLCNDAALACLDYADEEATPDLLHYFGQHHLEEQDHAVWLEADLRSTGWEPKHTDFLAAAAAGTQYYLIHHVHPVALLGYIAYLEANPTPESSVVALEERHGLQLLRTYRHHAVHDVDHARDLAELLDKLPAALQPIVLQSLAITLTYWRAAATRQDTGIASIVFTKLEQQ